MHELGLVRNLVSIVEAAAEGRNVRKIWLEVGCCTAVMPDAVRFCFDIVTRGTLLENAVLEIVEVPAGWRCTLCGSVLQETTASQCAECGSRILREYRGDELNVQAMEVETCV